MSSNKTEHLQLHRWEKVDDFLREEFNENFSVLDGAIGALNAERVAMGSYVGDGTVGRQIQLPFAPKFVIVLGHYSIGVYDNSAISILTEQDSRAINISGCDGKDQYNLLLVGDKLKVQHEGYSNAKGKTVYYIAVR